MCSCAHQPWFASWFASSQSYEQDTSVHNQKLRLHHRTSPELETSPIKNKAKPSNAPPGAPYYIYKHKYILIIQQQWIIAYNTSSDAGASHEFAGSCSRLVLSYYFYYVFRKYPPWNTFYRSWKTSAVSTTDWTVETQLRKLRGTSRHVRWACVFRISFYNMVFILML